MPPAGPAAYVLCNPPNPVGRVHTATSTSILDQATAQMAGSAS